MILIQTISMVLAIITLIVGSHQAFNKDRYDKGAFYLAFSIINLIVSIHK